MLCFSVQLQAKKRWVFWIASMLQFSWAPVLSTVKYCEVKLVLWYRWSSYMQKCNIFLVILNTHDVYILVTECCWVVYFKIYLTRTSDLYTHKPWGECSGDKDCAIIMIIINNDNNNNVNNKYHQLTWNNSLWLLRWLSDRLSKRQSLSTTTVLFRTTFTRTVEVNLLLKWLLSSNRSQ